MSLRDYNALLLLNGVVKTAVWGLGAGFACYRRRGLLAQGFGVVSILAYAAKRRTQ